MILIDLSERKCHYFVGKFMVLDIFTPKWQKWCIHSIFFHMQIQSLGLLVIQRREKRFSLWFIMVFGDFGFSLTLRSDIFMLSFLFLLLVKLCLFIIIFLIFLYFSVSIFTFICMTTVFLVFIFFWSLFECFLLFYSSYFGSMLWGYAVFLDRETFVPRMITSVEWIGCFLLKHSHGLECRIITSIAKEIKLWKKPFLIFMIDFPEELLRSSELIK